MGMYTEVFVKLTLVENVEEWEEDNLKDLTGYRKSGLKITTYAETDI